MTMIDTYIEEIESYLQNNQIKEAEAHLKQIKVDVHTMTDKDKKTTIQTKIKDYERIIALKRREELLESESTTKNKIDMQSSAPKTAEEGLSMLEASRKQLMETEEIGEQTLVNLQKQKDTIKHSHENLKKVNSSIKQGEGLLSQMSRWWRG